jgi:hypothetical protein
MYNTKNGRWKQKIDGRNPKENADGQSTMTAVGWIWKATSSEWNKATQETNSLGIVFSEIPVVISLLFN